MKVRFGVSLGIGTPVDRLPTVIDRLEAPARAALVVANPALAVPHVATGVNPRELLMQLLRDNEERTADRPVDREELLLRSIACKAAN